MSPVCMIELVLFGICVYCFQLYIYAIYYCEYLCNTYFPKEILSEYDYIIVGSGTSGSVITHRLATETNHTFIVIEAGGTGNPVFEIPVLGPFLHSSVYDWQFMTTPQKDACLAMKDNKCRMAQGKILGGSSKFNNMVHIRGNLSHYVKWFHGKYTKEYIKKQFEFIENDILHLEELNYQSELANAVLQAAEELGHEKLDIHFKKGFGKNILNQKRGKRWTAFDILDLKNVISNAFVENIIFDGNTAKAINVLLNDSKRLKLFAKRAIIISAGTYNSPKILQLSGIGPKNLLQSFGIPVVKNLPVGRNLQDHITTGLDFVLFNNSTSVSAIDMYKPYNVYQYFVEGKGPLTSAGSEVVGFLSTKHEETPDLQFMVVPAGLTSDRGIFLRKSLGITDEIWEKYFLDAIDKYAISILPILLHPKSKGTVFINSTYYKIPPIVDPKSLSVRDDIEVLVNGLKLIMRLVSSTALQSIGGFINPTPFPGCEHHELYSDPYFECYIRHLTLTVYHPIGTCSMGLPHTEDAVVDSSFKVIGVNNLFVVDGSVLPTMPSANINAAIAMMASIFFESNIATHNRDSVLSGCNKNDYLFEHLLNMCIVSAR